MKILATAIITSLLLIFIAGCATQQEDTPVAPTADNEEKGTGTAQSSQPKLQQQQQEAAAAAPVEAKQIAKNFYEFDKESYEAALSEGKYVFLDFYANWCPICKAEEPAIKAAFNELEAENVVGFRVNYNDDQTDNNEKALAKRFGITYQHTKIVAAPDEKVVSRTLKQQSRQEVVNQIKESTAATN